MPTVLIVETNPQLSDLLCTACRLYFPGLTRVTAHSLVQAVALQEMYQHFDVVILDGDIPMHHRVFQAFQEAYRCIVLSDNDRAYDKATTMIRKPFHLLELREAVMKLLSYPSLSKAIPFAAKA